MKQCLKCRFVDTLMAHPQGGRLLAAWWQMRRADPAFAQYLSGATLAETKRRVVADTLTNAPTVTAAALHLGLSRATLYRMRKR